MRRLVPTAGPILAWCLLMTFLVTEITALAAAVPILDCGGGELLTSVDCLSEDTTIDLGNEGNDAVDSPPIRYKTVTIPKIWAASDGEVCVKMVDVVVPEDQFVDPDGGLPHDRYSVCPSNLLGDAPLDPAAGAPTEDPVGYAYRYWKSVPLPVPDPYIAPGRAITGMFAYVETRNTTTHTYTEPNTPFGALTVVATGRYYVDWGDGTHTGPHSAEGGPWPDGKIKHEYIHVGTYDVVVTERWTATWSFGDRSGNLDELRTVGRIDDFPVQQIQAVVLR